MNPVYSIEDNYQAVIRNLKVLVVDSRTCLLDSLAKAIGSSENVDVCAAGSAVECLASYGSWEGIGSANIALRSGAYCDVARAVDSRQSKTFDVVLYCVGGFSAESALDDIELLASDLKDSRVIVVTEQQESRFKDLIDDDVIAGIIPAVYSTPQLVSCLWLVKSGVRFLPVEYQCSQSTDSLPRQGLASERLEDKLTPRQLEVLEYVSLGKSNKYIAAELSLCESTIKVHVHEVMKRLGATSRTHATYIVNTVYRSNQMIDPDSSLLASPQRGNAALAT